MGRPLARRPDRLVPGTAVVVFNERGEVLLQERADGGFWGLPGGWVDVGESVEQCGVRETLEETGVHVRVLRLIGVYSDPKNSIMSYPDGRVVQTVTCAFECERVSGQLSVSSESTDVRYFPAEYVPDNTVAIHRVMIGDALAGAIEALIR